MPGTWNGFAIRCATRLAKMREADQDSTAWHQEQAQRRAWLRLSYTQRLAWLDEAKRFVAAPKRLRRPTP